MKFWSCQKAAAISPSTCTTPCEKSSLPVEPSCSWSPSCFPLLHLEEWKQVIKRYKESWCSRCRAFLGGLLRNQGFIFTEVVLGRTLGSGASGTVYMANLNGLPVAVKIVRSALSESAKIPELFISKMHHRNVLHIMAVRQNEEMRPVAARDTAVASLSWDSMSSGDFSDMAMGIPAKEGTEFCPTQETWIMMEYCDLGTLSEGIAARNFHRGGDLNRPAMKKILLVASQVAEAMACLHRLGIVHGDLKAQNIFLKTDRESPLGYVAKVGDFGVSHRLHKHRMMRTNLLGTVDHMPPEVLRDGEVRTAMDVFSFGMILLEFITARRPFQFQSTASILVAIVEGVRPQIPSFVPVPYSDLIQDCWNQDWKKRPDFKDIYRRIYAMFPQLQLWEMHMEERIKFGERLSARLAALTNA